jgi:hypothetical protein
VNPACNICEVEYDREYEGPCQEFAASATEQRIMAGSAPLCPGTVSLTATLERRLTTATKQADVLGDALERFFYDLRFTAPEAIGMRLNQLGERIAPVMTQLGYPKRGVSADPDSGKARVA